MKEQMTYEDTEENYRQERLMQDFFYRTEDLNGKKKKRQQSKVNDIPDLVEPSTYDKNSIERKIQVLEDRLIEIRKA